MSFFSNSNSTANRRIKRSGARRPQSSVLEVTARPDREQRRQTRKKMGNILKVVLLVASLGGVAFGGKALVNRLIWENPTYALDDIRVTTDGLLTRAQVLELMEIQDGRNIFTVDLAKARKALDLLPQVEHVEVRRVLPSRIDVRISERQPVAWVAPTADTELGVDGRAFLVDTRGYVMRTRKVLPEHLALPVLVGVVMEDVAPGQKLPTAEALSAIELIRLTAEDIRWQPRVVDVSKGYCLLVTDQRRARVTFGFDNLEGQLSRLRQIIDYVEPMQREFQSVNLMLERTVPIVLAPTPPPPPVVPEPKGGKAKPPQGKVASVPAASAPAAVPALRSAPSAPVTARKEPEPAPRVAQPEPPSPFKMARLTTTSTPLPAPAERPIAEKPKRRVATRDDDADSEPVRPPKAVRATDATPKVSEAAPKIERSVERDRFEPKADKPKAAPQTKPPLKQPENPSQVDPGSLPPNESLRKLFTPHG